MRILDVGDGHPLREVCLYLTLSEAEEMIDGLQGLVARPQDQHAHVNDDTYEHEITLAVYTDGNLDQFDDRSKKLIADDQ